jgi:hypothetical protein
MPPPMNPYFFIIDFVFALTAIIFCLMIYFKTKESYGLTKYEGIKYFRDAFLFLGLAYLLRFIFTLINLSGFVFDIFIPRHSIFPIAIMLAGYFSTIGLIYLIFSLAWKYLGKKYLIILSHVLAIVASIVAFATRSPTILLMIQLALMIFFLIATIAFSKKINKKITKTKVLYLLVGILWFINLLTADRPIFSREIDISFRAIALLVFIAVYIRVSKWL